MTFKMMKEPKKPVRAKYTKSIDIEDMTLESLLNQIPYKAGNLNDDVKFKVAYEYSYDYSDDIRSVALTYPELEESISYNKRLEIYKEKKKKYDEWCSKNFEAIEEYRRVKASKIENDLFLSKEKKRQSMQKEFDRLKKALEKL